VIQLRQEARHLGADEPEPSLLRAWYMVAIFCFAVLVSYTDRLVFSLLVDPLRADLGISDTQISLVQGAAFALLYALAGLIMGRLADRGRRLRIIFVGVLVWTTATIACAFVTSFGGLILCRIVVGIGEAALAPAAVSMIGDAFPADRRGKPVGAFMMGQVVGSGLALLIGGMVLQSAVGGYLSHQPMLAGLAPWRVVLIVLGLPGLLVAMLLLTTREPMRKSAGAGEPSAARPFAQLLAQRAVLAPVLGAVAATSVGDFALLNWTPTLLSRNYHLAADRIGSMTGAAAIVAGIVGTSAAGLLYDRVGGRIAPALRWAAGSALFGLVIGLLGLAPTPTIAIGCFAIWFVVSWFGGTLGVLAVQQSVPARARGIAIASMSFCNIVIGLGGGTLLTALVTDRVFHDSRAVGSSLALIAFPAALVAAVLFARAARAADRAGLA
jgi:MFS family permease